MSGIKSEQNIICNESNEMNDDLTKNRESRLRKKIKKIKNYKSEIEFGGNSAPVDSITTERKSIEVLKESKNKMIDNNNSLNTSVDLRTSYGEEGIKNSIPYDFNHSSLTFFGNKNSNNSISNKDNSFRESNDKIIPTDNKKTESNNDITPIVEDKDNDNNNNNIVNNNNNDINDNNKNSINSRKQDEGDEINRPDSQFFFFIDENYQKVVHFKELMFYKNIEYENKYEIYENDYIFQTKIIYKNKNCNLLLNKEYLYILEIKSHIEKKKEKKEKKINNEYNPDLSLIKKLKNNKYLSINEKTLKKDYELSHPLVCLNFNLLSCKLLVNKKCIEQKNNNNYEIKIIILGTTKEISFFIENYDIYKKYIYLLGSKIHYYNGYKINRIGLSLRTDDFYKDTYISCKDFESMVKTGDLLLFRTIDCISDCQRFLTRDQYDHTAIIIRKNGIIELFESTSTDKCNLLEWRKFKFRLYNLVFKKIVLRRLNIEGDDPDVINEIQEGIEEKSNEFIQKVDKKNYFMSIPKMIFTSNPENYEIKREWDKAEGFCCSAMNAAFYIHNGIMKLEKSVHCVRPGDFEQDNNRLTIQPGFSFGPEKIIEFSEDFYGNTNHYK